MHIFRNWPSNSDNDVYLCIGISVVPFFVNHALHAFGESGHITFFYVTLHIVECIVMVEGASFEVEKPFVVAVRVMAYSLACLNERIVNSDDWPYMLNRSEGPYRFDSNQAIGAKFFFADLVMIFWFEDNAVGLYVHVASSLCSYPFYHWGVILIIIKCMLLYGSEIAGYMKEQQARAVSSLQHTGRTPRLALISEETSAPSDTYIALKQRYAEDIGVEAIRYDVGDDDIYTLIDRLNEDEDIHGIIVQLPLSSSIDAEKVLNYVAPLKDIDGLGREAPYDVATPTAILWLMSGYGIELEAVQVGLIGQGRLVGEPLLRMLKNSGHTPLVCDEEEGVLEDVVSGSDIIISATGKPGIITNEAVRAGQVVIDAGTADAGGTLVGDADPALYKRSDIKISPVPGGVGPLTVCALFANLIEAFKRQIR